MYCLNLLFRGRGVNSERGRALLKTCQYDAVTHLPRFYSKHRHHTDSHPCERSEGDAQKERVIVHEHNAVTILLILTNTKASSYLNEIRIWRS